MEWKRDIFRFASKSNDPEKVYSTSVISILFTSVLFLLLVIPLKSTIASWLNYKEHAEYILWFAIIVSIDALTAIPFARLRLKNRPIKFASIKLLNIGFAIGLNIFFSFHLPVVYQKPSGLMVKINLF